MFLLGKLFAGLELPSRVGRLASWPGIPAICFSSHPVLGLYATIKTLLFVLFFYFGSGDPKLRSFGLQGKYCMDCTQPDGAISFMTGFQQTEIKEATILATNSLVLSKDSLTLFSTLVSLTAFLPLPLPYPLSLCLSPPPPSFFHVLSFPVYLFSLQETESATFHSVSVS